MHFCMEHVHEGERRILQRSEVSALEVEAQVVVTSVDAGD